MIFSKKFNSKKFQTKQKSEKEGDKTKKNTKTKEYL